LKKIEQAGYGRGCGQDDPRVRIPARASVICVLQKVQTGSWVHTTSWVVCNIILPRG